MRNFFLAAVLLVAGALGAHGQTAKTLNATSADCSVANSCYALQLGSFATDYGTVAIQITGTWVATVSFEGTVDCAVPSWIAVSAIPMVPGATVSATVQSATGNGSWLTSVTGLCSMRARVSAYTSGSIVVALRSAALTSSIIPTDSTGRLVVEPASQVLAIADAQANNGMALFGPGATGSLMVYPFGFNGVTWDRTPQCNTTASVSVTAASTTQIVAGVAFAKVRVCSFSLSMSAAGTAQFVQGTGSNCGTGLANVTAAVTLATGTPWSVGNGLGSVLVGNATQALCVAAVTGNVVGFVTYAQY